MLKSDAAAYLAGVTQVEGAQTSAPTNLHVITGEVGQNSEDGKTTVSVDGLVFSEEDSQEIEMDTLGGLEEGDIATIILTGEAGHGMTPLAIGAVGSVDRINAKVIKTQLLLADKADIQDLTAATARIGDLEADHVTVNDFTAATGRIGDLEADNVTINGRLQAAELDIDDLEADHIGTSDLEAEQARVDNLLANKASVSDLNAAKGRISDLEADHVTVADFQAEQANIDTLQANTADISTIRANSAKVQNLTAAQLEADHATIGSLSTTYATISNLNAANGRIDTLESTKANISDLEADYITADEIEATYMHANMSNSDVAWIENGTIKNGAIVSAMINDVSANKLTAGTINGSVINVTNLNADNITTGTINGQRIGEGSLSLSKLEDDVYTETEVNNIVDGLNDRIDGAIETHTGTAVPTLNNSPASSWNTTKLRDEHVGDVYYVVNSQSQQNGYCYRFAKSGSTYSWQLIKDSDVTAALSRLSTAEGKITTFDSDISTLKTDTGTLTTRTTNLETRMSDAEDDILDKVDTTTFNEVSDTVDAHTRTISQHTTAISNKADNSTVTAVTNRVSKNEQDISGINTTIGQLQTTVSSKADGSTVTTISNKLNTVSDTVDGHTQTITSVQNTLSTKADSSTVSTLESRVSTNETSISQNTAAILLRATKSDAYQSAQPNLSPFFESTPYRTATSYDGGYWQKTSDNWLMGGVTHLSDGWAHIERPASTRLEVAVPMIDSIDSSKTYTLMFEWRNITVTGSPNLYARNYPNNCQFTKNSYNCSWNTSSPTSGVKYVSMTVDTTAKAQAWQAAINLGLKNGSGVSFVGDLRISLYEGDYSGPYKPYSGAYLYASKAELKITNDSISTKVDKDGVISSINQSAESVKIQASKVEIDGTAVFNAIKSSTDAAYDAKGSAENLINGGENLVGRFNYAVGVNCVYDYLTGTITSTATNNTRDNGVYIQLYVGTGTFVRQLDVLGTAANVGQLRHATFEKASDYTHIRLKFNGDKQDAGVIWDVSSIADGTELTLSCKLDSISSDGKGNGGVLSGINLRTGNMPSRWSLAPQDQETVIGSRNYAATNFKNFPIGTSQTRQSGVAATITGPSTFTLNGTATTQDWFFSQANVFGGLVLQVGTYTVWCTTPNINIRVGVGSGGNTWFAAKAPCTRDDPLNLKITTEQAYYFTPYGNVGASFSNQEVRLMVERSDKPTDWSPAPEDSLSEEQYIYISTASGTTSINKNTTWVTQSSDVQNVWTTKRPTYNSSYPVLFVAKQSKTVGGSVSCTTPVKDDTTTVIDGAHITTGTIDTNRLNADTIKSNIVQTTNLSASKITSGTLSTDRLDAATIKSNIVQTTNLSASQITSGDISADRIKANVIGAINSLTAGQIDAARINASQLTIGQSQVTNLTSDLYQSAQPNLTPFFEIAPTDTTYWFATSNLRTYTTKLENGWSHVECSGVNLNISPNSDAVELKESTAYTVMLEVRNAVTLTNCRLSTYAPANSMWSVASNLTVSENATYYITGTTKSDLSASTITHLRIFIGGDSTSRINADIRVSLYEGEYSGPYKPYSGTQLYATQSDADEAAKTATSYITTIDANNGIKIANANPSSATTYLQLASNFLDFIRGGVSMLKAWVDGTTAKVRLGCEAAAHIVIDSGSIGMLNGENEIFSLVGSETVHEDTSSTTTSDVSTMSVGNGEYGKASLSFERYHYESEVQDSYRNDIELGVDTDNDNINNTYFRLTDVIDTDSSSGTPQGSAKLKANYLTLENDSTDAFYTMQNVMDVLGGGVTLYDNANASASAAATLSESAANFRRLTIMYRDQDNTYSSVDVWGPNGKRVALDLTWINGASTQQMYQRVRWVTISGTTISTAKDSGDSKYRTGQVRLGGSYSVTNSDYISIVHVIGYR